MSPEPRHPFICLSRVAFRGIYTLLGGAYVEGLEHIPERGAALICSNHLSWADPPAIQLQLPRTCWFMANRFLFELPVLGRCMRRWGAFPVDRGMVDRRALREAEAHLEAGDLVCIFPEGGTSLTGRLIPFEGGPAMIALRAGVPIIPCGVTGSDRVLPMRPPYIPRYARGGVRVRFGPPIDPAEVAPGTGRKERVEALSRCMHDAVRNLLPAEYHPLPGDEELLRQLRRQANASPEAADAGNGV